MVLGWGAASHNLSAMFPQDADSRSKGEWIVCWQKEEETCNREI